MGTVLPEDFDVAHIVCCDDDVTTRVGSTSKVGGRFFGSAGTAYIGSARGTRKGRRIGDAGTRGSVIELAGRLRRSDRLASADECYRWWIAEVINRVAGGTEKLASLTRGHDRCRDDSGMCLEEFHRSPVLFDFRRPSRPDIGFSVFTSTDDIFGVFAEGSMDL